MVPNRCIRRLHQVITLPTEILRRWIDVWLSMQNVRLVQHTTISNQSSVAHLQRVARQPNEPLHKILRRVLGPLENDHVTVLWLAELWQPSVGEGDLGTVGELVHEQEIADEQRALHAPARDLERLDEKGAKEEEQQHRHRQ